MPKIFHVSKDNWMPESYPNFEDQFTAINGPFGIPTRSNRLFHQQSNGLLTLHYIHLLSYLLWPLGNLQDLTSGWNKQRIMCKIRLQYVAQNYFQFWDEERQTLIYFYLEFLSKISSCSSCKWNVSAHKLEPEKHAIMCLFSKIRALNKYRAPFPLLYPTEQ